MIMACISLVSFFNYFKWSPYRNFSSTRGLQKGYPLSPYLFILGADVLSHMQLKAEEKGVIHGVKSC